MKKILSIFVVLILVAPSVSLGAVTVHKKSSVNKKAAVETQQTSNLASATSLLPTALNLFSGVMSLKKAQQELTADCAPTRSEVELVNDLVKEWAKIGDTDAEGARGNFDPCAYDYQTYMELDGEQTCVDQFKIENKIWDEYPKAAIAKVGKKTYSNVYDIFDKIPFGYDDYTQSEAANVKKLIEKTERCAPSKISAKKRELWGGFLTSTITQVGSGAGVSGLDSVMQMATQLGGSGGGASTMLQGLGTIVPSVLQQ